MNYYSHNIGDYAQATMHLSLLEDAIYSRLLRRYYAEESALINDMAMLCRWVGARTEEEREAVEIVVNEFFTLQDDGLLHNKRADEEIAAFKEKSTKAQQSAAKRWESNVNASPTPKKEPRKSMAKPLDSERNANAMRTHSEGNANQEPITNNQYITPPNPPSPPSAESDLDLFEQAWAIFPKREGGNSRIDALKAWNARVKAGASPAEMLAGTKRYAAYCRDAGKTGTRFVKTGQTFYGPGLHYAERYTTDAGPADWWSSAGFRNLYEAENAGCTERTAYLWREGKRVEVTA